MTKVKATYVSEWDGGYQIETECVVNLLTGEVDAVACDGPELNEVETHDRDFVVDDATQSIFAVVETEDGYALADLEGFRRACGIPILKTADNAAC